MSRYQPNQVFFVSLSPANPVSSGQGNHYILSSIFRKIIKLKSPPTVWWSLGSHEDAAGAVSWLPVEYLMKFKPLTTGSGQTRTLASGVLASTSQSTDTSKQKIKWSPRQGIRWQYWARHRQLVSPRGHLICVISIMHSTLCTLHRWRVLTDSQSGYWSRHNPRIECRVVHTSYCHQRKKEEKSEDVLWTRKIFVDDGEHYQALPNIQLLVNSFLENPISIFLWNSKSKFSNFFYEIKQNIEQEMVGAFFHVWLRRWRPKIAQDTVTATIIAIYNVFDITDVFILCL